MKIKLIVELGIGLLVGIVLVAIGAFVFKQPYTYQGSLIDPPAPTSDFTLKANGGTTFQLSEQHGKIVLLFFGYTRCPDVCPTTLYDFKQIKASLGEQADEIRFVFITVDPERDTIDLLGQFVTAFDSDFIALSGELDELQPVYAAYGVYRQKNDVGSAAGYLMDHTARVYVIDPNGNLRLTFPFGMAPEAMTEDIIHLLKE
ncbi:MAG: SCO family protein [Chloroflexi bacterium]|jgi:protein SCO1|nr:SCO family protein [Chloroflexota bacterium]